MKNNRKILFITKELNTKTYHYYVETNDAINNNDIELIVTSNLSFMCFDLLDKGFKTIKLLHNDRMFELKLGENDWTAKDLSKAHNLYKLVMGYIINK